MLSMKVAANKEARAGPASATTMTVAAVVVIAAMGLPSLIAEFWARFVRQLLSLSL